MTDSYFETPLQGIQPNVVGMITSAESAILADAHGYDDPRARQIAEDLGVTGLPGDVAAVVESSEDPSKPVKVIDVVSMGANTLGDRFSEKKQAELDLHRTAEQELALQRAQANLAMLKRLTGESDK